jgi:hypothetical protein
VAERLTCAKLNLESEVWAGRTLLSPTTYDSNFPKHGSIVDIGVGVNLDVALLRVGIVYRFRD